MCHKIRCDEKSSKLFGFQGELNKAQGDNGGNQQEFFFIQKSGRVEEKKMEHAKGGRPQEARRNEDKGGGV